MAVNELTPEHVKWFEAEVLNYFEGVSLANSRFGFIYSDFSFAPGYTACHSTMGAPEFHGYAIIAGPGTGQRFGGYDYYTKKEREAKRVVGFVNWWYGNIPEDIKRWYVDPVVSPWRDLMKQDFYAMRTNSGALCVVVGDFNHSNQLLTNYFKSGRLFSEYKANGETMRRLVAADVHPTLAYFFGELFQCSPQGALTPLPAGWHGSTFMSYGKETLDNFVAGKYKTEKETLAQRNFSYYGCDKIFGYNDLGRQHISKDWDKYKPAEMTSKRAFGADVKVAGWSIETITTMCQQLEKEYGLEPYTTTPSVSRRESTRIRKSVGTKRLRVNHAA